MMTNFKKNSSKGTANHLLSYVSTNTYSRIEYTCHDYWEILNIHLVQNIMEIAKLNEGPDLVVRVLLSCILDFSWLTFNSDSYNANEYNDKTMILIINRSIKLNNKCNANFFRFLFKL